MRMVTVRSISEESQHEHMQGAVPLVSALEQPSDAEEPDSDHDLCQKDDDKKDTDDQVHVHLTVEYHGTHYGGWQRQGLKNHITLPSIQGTLEEAATKACRHYFSKTGKNVQNQTDTTQLRLTALMAATCGRTDKAVHALQHRCVMRLPILKANLTPDLETWLVGICKENNNLSSSSLLSAMNQVLPLDVRVLICHSMSTSQQRKQLRFPRKRYRYLIQQPPTLALSLPFSLRPVHAWYDYTWYVKEPPLDVTAMLQAAQYMVGTHDFRCLSCQKPTEGGTTIRTIYAVDIKVVAYPYHDAIPWFAHAQRAVPIVNHKKNTALTVATNVFDVANIQHSSDFAQHSSFKTTADAAETDTDGEQVDNNKDGGDCNININTSVVKADSNGHSISLKRPRLQQQTMTLAADTADHLTHHYRLISISFEGSGFLRHQVRRMVSVLYKVGIGTWSPESVRELVVAGDTVSDTNSNNDNSESHQTKKKPPPPNPLQGQSLAPGRGLWLDRVWTNLPVDA